MNRATGKLSAALSALTCLVIASCAAPPSADVRTIPAGDGPPAHEVSSFRGHDGTMLADQSWHPAEGVRAVLVVVHGFKDHSSNYAELAAHLTPLGFAVYGYDHRGHGYSAGRRATVDSFDEYLNDLDLFLARVRAREPGKPLFLLGHSAGGLMATLYTLERRPALAGLVLSAPAIRVDRANIEAAATPFTADTLPNLPVVHTPDERFSRTPAVVAEMGEGPLVYHHDGPARTAGAVVAAIERVWSRADTLAVPLLGLHGTGDLLTDPRGTAELVRRTRAHGGDATLHLYRGLYHDLLHEPERATVIDDVVTWLDVHVPRH